MCVVCPTVTAVLTFAAARAYIHRHARGKVDTASQRIQGAVAAAAASEKRAVAAESGMASAQEEADSARRRAARAEKSERRRREKEEKRRRNGGGSGGGGGGGGGGGLGGGVGAGSDRSLVQSLTTMLKCSVCHDNFKNCVVTKCWHLFCKDCVQKNLKARNRKCPICKKGFGADDVHDVYMAGQ